MNPYRTFALQVSDRKRNRILWGHAQQQMDVVRHRMPFQHLDTFLLTQLPQYLADLTTPACKKLLLPVLWYQHHMILAVTFHMGLTLPIFHLDPPWPFGAFLKGGSFHIHAGNGRAFTVLTGRAGGLTLI